MTYKGYSATLEIDEEAGELFGRVQGTRHIITFGGQTIEEARRSFEETIDAYLESCRESGEEPDRPSPVALANAPVSQGPSRA
jgi:predicted HicB family RNase H-like nuclease